MNTPPLCNRCRVPMAPGMGVVPVWVCSTCGREVPMEPGVGVGTSSSGVGERAPAGTGPDGGAQPTQSTSEIGPVAEAGGGFACCDCTFQTATEAKADSHYSLTGHQIAIDYINHESEWPQ